MRQYAVYPLGSQAISTATAKRLTTLKGSYPHRNRTYVAGTKILRLTIRRAGNKNVSFAMLVLTNQMGAWPGFEPGMRGYEPDVIPLHYLAVP